MGIEDTGGSAPSTPNSAPEGVNWADLAVDASDEGAFVFEPVGADSEPVVNAEPPGADPAATPVVVAPGTPSTQTPVVETPPQGQPSIPPVQQSPAVQTPVQEVPAQPQGAPVNLAELQAKYVQQLQTDYQISQEDAIALQTQPETVVPRLASMMHMRVMQDVSRHIQEALAFVPQMLQQQLAQQEAETSAKQEFFGAWPGLSPHYQTAVKNAMMVRQANPQATRQQVIEMAGMMTAVAVGLDPQTARAQGVQQVHRPAQVQSQIPPRPAAVGSGPGMSAQAPTSVWGELADEDREWMTGAS